MSLNVSPVKPDTRDLFSTVVRGGYCIGCGLCAAFDPQISMQRNRFGCYEASKSGTGPVSHETSKVCAFADGNPSEDQLGLEIYGDIPNNKYIGRHISTYAGWVEESDFRAKGSSGGFASWLLVELLEKGLVDYVIHVVGDSDNSDGSPLFKFSVSNTSSVVRGNPKSRYYPVEMSGVIEELLKNPGRYAVVGIPCFIKGLRLAARQSQLLRERLTYAVGIVCGHLKSSAFAEALAWQCGVSPDNLGSIDFRTKLPDRPASSYGITVAHKNSVKAVRPVKELYGTNWGHGLFKYKACDFCDDVVGETADVSVGDAWLPGYVTDAKGANVIVVRSAKLDTIIKSAIDEGRLHLNIIPVEDVIESQAGGFRHRRDGLAYRLFLEDKADRWRPEKRVEPNMTHLSKRERNLYKMRSTMSQASHIIFASAKAAGDLGMFIREMRKITTKYDRRRRPPLIPHLFKRAGSLIKRISKRKWRRFL